MTAQPLPRALTTSVKHFIEQRVVPSEGELAHGGDNAHLCLRQLQTEAKSLGIWSLAHRKPFGGAGLSLGQYARLAEIEGRSEWGPAVLGSHTLLDAEMLADWAPHSLQERYLSGLVDGSVWPSFALTEPGISGSTPEAVRTTAKRVAGAWQIDGIKWFTSHAMRADYALVVCRTEDVADAKRALSLLLVPTDTPGYELVRELPILGLLREHSEVRYTSVVVPQDHLIGERGQGFELCAKRLTLGRALRCLHWLGLSQRAFDAMCQRAIERPSGVGYLADKQLVQAMVFESYSDIASMRDMLFSLIDDVANDAKSVVPMRVSAVKVFVSRGLCRVVDRALQLYGAEGLSDDTPLSALYRLARATRIYDGPDEVHASSVGKSVLKRYAQAGDTSHHLFAWK